jgi:hypothetical protein
MRSRRGVPASDLRLSLSRLLLAVQKRGPRPLKQRRAKIQIHCNRRKDLQSSTMNSQKFTILPWMVAGLFGAIFCVSSCDKVASPVSKLTRANFDQIHEKTSKDEVRAILGSPSSTSTEDKLIYKRTTWRYVEGDKYINITFKNDELDSKDTNLGTK